MSKSAKLHPDMKSWQYRTLLAELSQVTLHASDESCPCNQVGIGEYCLAKHLLNVSSLAQETALMDDAHRNMLDDLAIEALGHHEKAKTIYCKGGEWPDLAQWSREWRKKIEPAYYACSAKVKELITASDVAKLFEKPTLRVTGTCEPDTCSFKVKATDTTEAATASIKELKKLVKEVSQRATAKGKPVAATNKTFAMGITTTNRYEFEFKIVNGTDLIVSHDPFSFVLNPKYIAKIQPRMRERIAAQLQVRNIAAQLDPDLLLLDFLSLEKGTPIVGSDNLVECGNGRVMALLVAAKEHPDRLEAYRDRLKQIAPSFGLSTESIDQMKIPVLVRVRLTPVDRKAFAEECNASTVIETSAIEKARTDAEKITESMLQSLDVLENESIQDALRSGRNKQFTASFLGKLPANEQATLVDAKGILNFFGVRRMAMAIFVATFRGDVGIRLAEKFFESTDPNVLNTFNGISRSLGLLARAETLATTGQRLKEYAFGEDLAKAVSVFSTIKKTPSMTVEKYIAQQQLEARELTPFQEHVLQMLDEHSASGKFIGNVLTNYAQLVIASAPPAQEAFIPGVRSTKEQLFEQALSRAEAVAEAEKIIREQRRASKAEAITAEDVAQLFAPRRMTKAEWERALKYQLPLVPTELPKEVAVTPPCPPVCLPTPPRPEPAPAIKHRYELFDFQKEGVTWLKGRSFALLADEMGLGKTPQAIYWGADFHPVLVIVPASLTFNWRREITEMWRPQDTLVLLDGKQELPKKLPDWTILSYGMLSHYLPELKRAGFKAIIIDEAHLIKNLETQRTDNVLSLVAPRETWELESYRQEKERLSTELDSLQDKTTQRAKDLEKRIADADVSIKRLREVTAHFKPIPNRLAVTGTPVVNRPIELFALLVFLGVKTRGDFREFLERYTQHKYVKGRMVFTGAKNLYELHQSIKPFMLRRMKKDVLKQLPPKVNTPMFVPISNAAEYMKAERNFLAWLRNKQGNEAAFRAAQAEIITKMNALRLLSATGKVQPVCDWLKPCRDGQGKVLVFSSFIVPLDLLHRCKPESVLYTGALSAQERQTMVDHFQHTSGVCYFMGTIGAAGVGITLTAASRVCFLDLPWTPGGKIQAEDRAHRIGQSQTVEIVNILAKGTIDERMLAVLREKELIISQAIDGKTRDEAANASIANALIESYTSAPVMAEPVCQYEPEMAEPEPRMITGDDLQILQGFNEVTVEDVASLSMPAAAAEVTKKFPYVDEYGKTIVKKVGEFQISVNNLDNPTYLAVWEGDKKVGEMVTTSKAVSGAEDYVLIGKVEIKKAYYNRGLATELYKVLLDHLPAGKKGIMAYDPDVIASKKIPRIYAKLGAIKDPVTGNLIILKKPVALPKATGMPYEWLSSKLTPCNLSEDELRRALSWRPLRVVVMAALAADAKAQLCSVGMVAGIYELSLNNLTTDADERVLNLVAKTTRIKQVYTPVAGQRVFEVRVPVEIEPSELTWEPKEVIERRGERGEQVAMFEYQPNKPRGFVIESVGSIVPKQYEAFKVGVNLERSKQWDIAKAPTITKPEHAQQFFDLARKADREWLLVICLDTHLRLVGIFEQSIGTQTEALVSPLELARVAVLTSATSLILAHNHPSGDPVPSEADMLTFERVKKGLALIQVEVPDFFVIGHKADYSMAGNKALRVPEREHTTLLEPKPRWCYGVEATAKELSKLTNRLARAKTKVGELGKKLETPVQICRGQKELFGGAEMAENTTIKVSGKCATDDIDSCVFTIRRVGKAIRAKGYKELSDALEGTLDKLAKRKAKVKEEAQMEAKDKYAKGYLPKEISVYPNVIIKHYIYKEDCQAKTFRVLKPEPNILVNICCAKGDELKAGRCHPNPTVHKTIVPRNEKYEKELAHLRKVHPEIPVTYHKEEGVEAREPLTQSIPVLGEAHSVNIPLTCPGTTPVSPELEQAMEESEVA